MHPQQAATGAMDQRKEEEGKGEQQDNSVPSVEGRAEEEKDDSEEQVLGDQRKAEEEERSSDGSAEETADAAVAARTVWAHPCSLLQYMIWACARYMGFEDSSGDPKPGAAPAAPDNYPPSQEGEEGRTAATTRGVTTGLRAVKKPKPPSKPREGRGGYGGQIGG